MIKIINLFTCFLFGAIFFTQAIATPTPSKSQKTNLANNHNTMLIAKDTSGKCLSYGNIKINSKISSECKTLRNTTTAISTASPSQHTSAADIRISTTGARCAASGSSKAGATGKTGAFCLAADINTLKTSPAHFAVANSLPMRGLQFLQISFRDGNKIVGTRPIPSPGATISSRCISVGGSNSATTGKSGDFCIAADLKPSTTTPAHFSLANSSPVANLQIIQVTFRHSFANQSLQLPIAGAKCTSLGGSLAINGDSDGFCLTSDLKTSTTNLNSFTTVNKLPAASLQLLQVSFRDRYSVDSSGQLINAPLGAKCLSTNTSTASTGATGEFCLVSTLSSLTTGFSNFSIANDLPVDGLQFLQVIYANDDAVGGSIDSLKCRSTTGSVATVGNKKGFCLAADRKTSDTSYAGLSIANNLPATAVQFMQVPFIRPGQALSPRKPIDAAAASGVTLTDLIRFPTQQRLFLPDFARIAGRNQQFFGISEADSGIVMHSSPITHSDNLPAYWISR